mgnify:FL=1
MYEKVLKVFDNNTYIKNKYSKCDISIRVREILIVTVQNVLFLEVPQIVVYSGWCGETRGLCHLIYIVSRTNADVRSRVLWAICPCFSGIE